MNIVEIGKKETLTSNIDEIVLYQPDSSIRLDKPRNPIGFRTDKLNN